MTNMTIEELRRIHDEWKTSGLSIQNLNYYCLYLFISFYRKLFSIYTHA